MFRVGEKKTRSVWDRGSCHVGSCDIDIAGGGRWYWGLLSVAAVGRTAVARVMCRGLWCRELSKAALLGTDVSRIFGRELRWCALGRGE